MTLPSGSSEVTFVQVQVLLPAPKIWRRASARLHIFRFGYSSQNLLNAAGVGSRQRLAFCGANDGAQPSRQTCDFACKVCSNRPFTRTKTKRNAIAFLLVLVCVRSSQKLPAAHFFSPILFYDIAGERSEPYSRVRLPTPK